MKAGEKVAEGTVGTEAHGDRIADRQEQHKWSDPKTLKVNPKFQRLIPLQSRGELLALEESIKADGCRDPLLVWAGHNIVLDGHTRRELCIKHKKQVPVREVELADEKAAVEFILTIQRQRRNLTREAMSYFRGEEYNATKQPRGGDRSSEQAKGQTDPLPTTAKLLADKYGVSEKTIKRDGVFAEGIDQISTDYGDPDLTRTLLGADVRLTHGGVKALLGMSPAARKKAIDKLTATGELPRAKRKDDSAQQRPKEVAQSLCDRLRAKGEKHARSVIEQMARLLGLEVQEPTKQK